MTKRWSPPTLAQPATGYRASIDAWLVAGFAAQTQPRFFVDLGTGCGVVAKTLCQLVPSAQGLAVERGSLVSYARQNLAHQPVTVIQSDLRTYTWAADCFDLAVCNPPYYQVGRGRLSQETSKAEARYSLYGSWLDFVAAIGPALKTEGFLCFIYPAALLDSLFPQLAFLGWYPEQILLIKTLPHQTPSRACVCLRRRQQASQVISAALENLLTTAPWAHIPDREHASA